MFDRVGMQDFGERLQYLFKNFSPKMCIFLWDYTAWYALTYAQLYYHMHVSNFEIYMYNTFMDIAQLWWDQL